MNGEAPVEEWDWSLKTTQPATPLDGAALLAHATAMVSIWNQTVANVQSKYTRLTECIYAVTDGTGKVQRFPDGSYVQGKVTVADPGRSAVDAVMPLQTALCVSLSSARPGATGRGRFFLPWQNYAAVGPDFRLTQAAATEVAQDASALINQVNALGQPCVINSSKGTNSVVNRVRVGLVLDTMRSRREKVPEGYIIGPAIV